MTSTQEMLAQVIETTGATRADIIRVATQGGVTQADRTIAEAIEAAGGRRAEDLMTQSDRAWKAEHNRLQNALWHETQPEDVEFLREHAARAGITDIEPLLPAVATEPTPEPTPAAPTLAPDITVYTEDANTLVTDIPESRPRTPEDETEDETIDSFVARVYSDLDDLLRCTLRSTGRLVRSWTCLSQARRDTAALVNQARRRAQRRSRPLPLAA